MKYGKSKSRNVKQWAWGYESDMFQFTPSEDFWKCLLNIASLLYWKGEMVTRISFHWSRPPSLGCHPFSRLFVGQVSSRNCCLLPCPKACIYANRNLWLLMACLCILEWAGILPGYPSLTFASWNTPWAPLWPEPASEERQLRGKALHISLNWVR